MIYVDTGFLFALISERDAQHVRVLDVFRSFRTSRRQEPLITTNYVVAESITLTRRIGHAEAVRLGQQ